jgi:hypothetical protein
VRGAGVGAALGAGVVIMALLPLAAAIGVAAMALMSRPTAEARATLTN